MKFITILLSMILSSQAFAHTDHALGEGNAHALYHAVFWSIFALVVFKAVKLYKAKKNQSKDNQ